jgi:hypothetical protein
MLRADLDTKMADQSALHAPIRGGAPVRIESAAIDEAPWSLPGQARIEHRLPAILAAGVAGYWRLIEADEEGTLGRLRAVRVEVKLGAQVERLPIGATPAVASIRAVGSSAWLPGL